MADLPGFLVTNDVGLNRKLRRLTPPERWCALAGVWAVASMSPVRGFLLIAEGVRAVEEDYADQAGVPVAVARSCVRKLRELGMLEVDPESGDEHVHDWHQHQPEARRKPSDSREAWRKRKAKQRSEGRDQTEGHAGSHADVPRDKPDVTPPEEEVEGEETADAVSSPAVPAFDADVIRLCQLQSDLARSRTDEPASSRRLRPTKAWHVEMDRLIRLDGRTPRQVENAIRWVDQHRFWRKVVLSVPTLREKFPQLVADAKAESAPRPAPADDRNAARRERTRERLGGLLGSTEDDTIEGTVAHAA